MAEQTYPAVPVADSALSVIKGTSLSLFGMDIDLADFVSADWDETCAPGSYQQCLAHAMNRLPKPEKPSLPASHVECETFALWYFRSVNPFLPAIHKADFMATVGDGLRFDGPAFLRCPL